LLRNSCKIVKIFFIDSLAVDSVDFVSSPIASGAADPSSSPAGRGLFGWRASAPTWAVTWDFLPSLSSSCVQFSMAAIGERVVRAV
jgi:hypothetical protein